MWSGIWKRVRNSLKTLLLIFGKNLLMAHSSGRMKGRLPPELPEIPSQDSSSPLSPFPSLSISSSPPSTSTALNTFSLTPSTWSSTSLLGIELMLPFLTTQKSRRTLDMSQKLRRSPLHRGLTTGHLTCHLTSDYLQVTDPL